MDKDYHGSSDSGTDHAQFRQYYDWQGRWMSPDPSSGSYDFSNPQSLNRYSYAMNNPLTFTDPSGLDPPCTPDNDGVYCLEGTPGIAFNIYDYFPNYWRTSFIVPSAFPNGPNLPTAASVQSRSRPGTNKTLQQNWRKDLKALKTCSSGSASSAAAGVGLVAAGSNVISTAGKFAGSTSGTSIASQLFRTILPQSIDATLAPTLMNPLATSSTLGGVVGRWVPIAGESLFIYSGVKFLNCISDNGDGFW
jgi:RHS repeat-associated protein